MGNAHSLTRPSGALDSFVADLGGDIVYERSLGSARFLKMVKCRHKNGYLVVKMFIKPDPGLSLRKYHRRLKVEREALLDIPNVYNYQHFVENDKAGYIIRQWIASSLYDRISTRPFLSMVEKKWIAFQLLNALRDARNRKISHGDIKSENILVTSWNWVYLSDFASYKPTYLPLDDPSDFSFFFDTSGRRTCYIAPERFYTATDNPDISAKKSRLALDDAEGRRDGKVNEAMDCFSAGCVIAELFLEGAPLFTLSQLFKYREGELSVDSQLSAIDDGGVKVLIKQMIAIDPSTRPTFDTLLQTSRGTVFPEAFYSFLHSYVSSVNELRFPSPFAPSTGGTTPHPATPSTTSTPTTKVNPTVGSTPAAISGDTSSEPLPSDSDHRMCRIWADFDSIEPYLAEESGEETVMDVRVEYTQTATPSKAFQDVLPVELCIPNRESKLSSAWSSGRRAATEDGPALIILAIVCANIRNCYLPSSRVRALDVFLALSSHLTDEAKLDRMTPYIVDLLHDDAAIVRAAALRTLMQVLMLVTVITPSNAAIFPEYIIPAISHLVRDPEVSVRCMYAQCIAALADTAVRYLEMGQALKAHGTYQISADTQEYDEAHFEVSYDASMQDLQNNIQEHLASLLIDPSSVVKRAVLHNISSLCIFLGRQKTNDVLLSHMNTYLNHHDWLLRHAFFESVVDVAACAGGRTLEKYILPLMIPALFDVEEAVVAKVLAALTTLCELGLFQRMRIWELVSATLGFLYHPNIWIRQGAAAFIASAGKTLPSSDVWAIVYPSLKHFLRSDVRDVDERSLLTAVKAPLPRRLFDSAVQWAMKDDKTQFWRTHRSTKSESPRGSVAIIKQGGAVSSRAKSKEDEAQITKLQQLGMTSAEEVKLLAMRDYILKLAGRLASRATADTDAENLKTTSGIELQKLGVVPQTVFLKAPRIPSRRSHTDLSVRSPVAGTPRSGRTFSIDQAAAGGAPLEDLRRRLAIINGSASSLAVPGSRDARSPQLHPLDAAALHSADVSDLPQAFDRPGSPADSVTSTTNSSALRTMHRLQIGSTDGQKAAPAIGASKTNVTGLLEAHSLVRSDGSEPSGRSSPVSPSGTIRAHETPRVQSSASGVAPISTYDGQEPGISHLLEHLYLDNNREAQNEFGPRVHEGPVRRRNAARHSFMTRESSSRRPETTLISHLSAHSDAITGLAVSPDHMFFVSGSDDKTVKVWDTARLERNVTSKPRQTYEQHARVKCVCMLEGVHCFASAGDDGSLHIVRVHTSQGGTLPKYTKLHRVREHRLEHDGEYITSMAHWNTETISNLIYATTFSVVYIMDLRSMRILQTMENPRQHGPITCICLDRKRTWVVCGTSTGVLSLWDIRFGILIKSWKVGVTSKGRAMRVHQCVVHPSKGKGKWIVVALETPKTSSDGPHALLEVWDIEQTALVETMYTRVVSNVLQEFEEPKDTAADDVEASPAAAIAALVRSRQDNKDNGSSLEAFARRARSSTHGLLREDSTSTPSPDIRSMVIGTEFGGHHVVHRSAIADLPGVGKSASRSTTGRGFLLCGSEDRRIRYWDLTRVERSATLSGLETESDRPSYSAVRSSTGAVSTYLENCVAPNASNNRPPQRLSLINHNQQNLLKGHQDTVTALACVDSPFRGGIVSGDHAGTIKVWKVEGLDLS